MRLLKEWKEPRKHSSPQTWGCITNMVQLNMYLKFQNFRWCVCYTYSMLICNITTPTQTITNTWISNYEIIAMQRMVQLNNHMKNQIQTIIMILNNASSHSISNVLFGWFHGFTTLSLNNITSSHLMWKMLYKF